MMGRYIEALASTGTGWIARSAQTRHLFETSVECQFGSTWQFTPAMVVASVRSGILSGIPITAATATKPS